MLITALYAGLMAIVVPFMIVKIARLRTLHKVSRGDGEVEELSRFIRAHANFIETVPLALILMAIMETQNFSIYVLHLMGIALIISRLCHWIGMTTGSGYGRMRMIGMILVMALYLLAGLALIWLFLSWTLFSL